MIQRNYETDQYHVIVFYLNKGESVEMHTHDWDHELVCIMGEVLFTSGGKTLLLSSESENHGLAIKDMSHGFTANCYSIVLNLTKK